MLVREGMTEVVLSVGPGHTLREAAAAMCNRRVGAAVVLDPLTGIARKILVRCWAMLRDRTLWRPELALSGASATGS